MKHQRLREPAASPSHRDARGPVPTGTAARRRIQREPKRSRRSWGVSGRISAARTSEARISEARISDFWIQGLRGPCFGGTNHARRVQGQAKGDARRSRNRRFRFLNAALRWTVATLIGLCSVGSPGTARAQEAWWLVEVEADEAEQAVNGADVASLVETLSGRDIRPYWGEEARRRFEEQVSMPASLVSQNDIDEWVARSRDAVRSLARADYERAREQLLEAQRLSQNAAEELNREVARARQVLDTCLFMVRAFLETNNRDEAERQARECRRLVPTVEPTQVRHTPDVRELLARIDRALAEEPPARLRVESTPAGCVVRVNGIEFGETPYLVDDLRPGDYRLQVECDPQQRGRVRRLRLGQGSTSVEVDSAFDMAFRSRPRLALRRGASREHLQTFASLLGGSVVAMERTPEGWLLQRYDSAGLVSQSRSSGDDWERVIDELSERQSSERWASEREDEPTEAVSEAEPEASSPRPSTLRMALGIGALTLSVGAITTGVVLSHQRGQRGDLYAIAEPVDIDFLQRQQRWRDLETPVYLLAGTGFALGVTAAALLTRDVEGMPWWTWASGSLGVAAVVLGVVVASTAPSCGNVAVDRQECVDRGQALGLASSLLAGGGILLSVPVAAAFGGGDDGPVMETAMVPGGARFGFRWRM